MPTLVDAINELKKAGYNNDQIIIYLQEQGFKPKEILDAINQAKLSEQAPKVNETLEPSIIEKMPIPTPTENSESEQKPGMSIPLPTEKEMKESRPKGVSQQIVEPIKQTETAIPTLTKAEGIAMKTGTQNIFEEAPYSEAIPQPTYSSNYGYDIETLEALAEEIVKEKFEQIRNKIENINEMKKSLNSKIKEVEDRLKRVELNLDKIHLLILEKQEKQNKQIKAIGKEIGMLETAFSKILTPLRENIKRLEEISKELKGK